MRTVESRDNSCLECTTDELDFEEGHILTLKCNAELAENYNVLKPTLMGHKKRYYEQVLSKDGARPDSRSNSLPNCCNEEQNKLLNIKLNNTEDCDTSTKLLNENCNDLWFKTWPERCDKLKTNDANTDESLDNSVILNSDSSKPCDINSTTKNVHKLTLKEALQSISLAYSPITKQLHLVEENKIIEEQPDEVYETDKKTHKRNNPGSFSSTLSTISDPSTSGSFLESGRSSPVSENGGKSKTNFSIFNRNVFPWKSNGSNNSASFWKIFSKSATETSPQHVISSAALIQHIRPSNLPAKTSEEEQRHRDEYKEILAAAKRKETQNCIEKQKQHKLQLQLEEQQAAATKHFMQNVLRNWETMRSTKKTKEMWWLGLPSSVRGKVWRSAIGNDLNLTQHLYDICVTRAKNRLENLDAIKCDSDIDQESSMEVIRLDISRTFPNLCIFQEGGPYSEILHSLLAAYVCYRPDVGYVQGMSYIAAILILNMDQFEAFVSFSNILNRPLHMAAFTLNQLHIEAYFAAYNKIFDYNLPKLCSYFQINGLTPDLYLLDWIYTIFAKAMPLDVACRVWDVFLRDGEEFIFRTALGILHLNQDLLMKMDFLHGAQFLTHLPEDMSVDQLFKSISVVSTSIGKKNFNQIVEKCLNSTERKCF